MMAIGPVIENGFYYDIEMDYRLNDDDLKKIQDEMQKIIKEDIVIERIVLSKEEALRYFGKNNRNL